MGRPDAGQTLEGVSASQFSDLLPVFQKSKTLKLCDSHDMDAGQVNAPFRQDNDAQSTHHWDKISICPNGEDAEISTNPK
jgi:hypothetical protein